MLTKKIAILIVVLFSTINTYSQLIEEYRTCAIERANMKDYEGAIDYFTRIIELNSKDTISYFDRAMMKENCHDYKGAIEDYTRGIAFV